MRESFVFYRSFFDAICELDDKKRLKMYDYIAKFALKNEEPEEINGICKQLFVLIKPQILANNVKMEQYQKDVENGKKGAEYGKLGGRPKKHKQEEKTPPGFSKNNPLENPINENVNVNDNENENENINPLTPFQGEQVSPKKKKIKYGQYRKVMLTDDEYKRLVDDFGLTVVHDAINFLDNYIEEKGYKSKSHNLTIRRWVIDAVTKQKQSPPPRGATDWDKIV